MCNKGKQGRIQKIVNITSEDLVSWLDNLVQKTIMPMPSVPNTYDFDIFENASHMHTKKY